MNRLSNHLAAIGLAPTVSKCYTPQVPFSDASQLKHGPHYRIVRYRPSDFDPAWHPKHVGDCVNALEYKQCKFGPRFRTLPEALAVVHAENRQALMERLSSSATVAEEACDHRARRWSSIACVEGPGKVALMIARVALPLRYLVVRATAPSGYKPSSLLVNPTWAWFASASVRDLEWHETMHAACQDAIDANRDFASTAKKQWLNMPLVRLVLACEHDSAAGYFHAEGSLLSVHECLRFHVVDESWPLDDATRAELAKGGAQ